MSSEDGRKILTLVQNRIERCLRQYMYRKEVISTLYMQDSIEPHVTELVWQKLEEENHDFFRAYYLRLMVKEQIMEFNKLLSDQVDLMRQLGPSGIASISMSNGAHLPLMHQNMAAGRAEESPSSTLKPDSMQRPVPPNLHNVFNNCGPSVPSCVQPSVDLSSHGRKVDVPANMMMGQTSNRGLSPMMDGGLIKSEPGYTGNPHFKFGAHNNLVESRAALCDASVSSYSSAESNSQALNEPILDADSSSFGLLEQISQHFNFNPQNDFSNVDFASFPDMLDTYSRPLFLPTDSDNFVDPHGDIEKFNAASDSFRFSDLGGD